MAPRATRVSAWERSRDDHGRTTCRCGRRPRPDRDGRAALPACRRSATPCAPVRAPASAACRTARSTTPPRSPCASTTLPAIPTLPRRSPAEGMIAQALVGIGGVTLGQYGSIAVDADHLDPDAPVATDIGHDAFGGLRAFLADGRGPPVPRPGQVAVHRPGHARRRARPASACPADRAFAVAARAVRAHVAAIADGRRRRAAGVAADRVARRAVVRRADEPGLPDRARPGDRPAVDGDGRCSSPSATVGVHCCADADVASLLAAGPAMLSIPLDARARRRRRLPQPLPRGRRVHRVGRRSPTDGPIADDRPSGRGGCCRRSGASSSTGAATPSSCASAASSRRRAGSACTRRRSPTGSCASPARSAGGCNDQAVASRFALGA